MTRFCYYDIANTGETQLANTKAFYKLLETVLYPSMSRHSSVYSY